MCLTIYGLNNIDQFFSTLYSPKLTAAGHLTGISTVHYAPCTTAKI